MTVQAYIRVILKWWWLFLLLFIGGAVLAYWIQSYLGVMGSYTATASVSVGTEVGGLDQSNSDLTLADSLVTTYTELARRSPISDRVVAALGLDMAPATLVQYHLETLEVEKTQLIELTGKHPDPELAAAIANETARQLQAQAPVRPTRLIQIVSLAKVPASRDVETYLLVGLAGVVGLLMAGGIVLLIEFALDRPYTPEWASQRVEIPVLGTYNSRNTPGRSRFLGRSQKADAVLNEPVWWVVLATEERLHKAINLSANGHVGHVEPESESEPSARKGQSIVVTSMEKKKSKSSAALALAYAAAASGHRTILVDADVRPGRWQRQTSLQNWLDQGGSQGLLTLAQNGTSSESIQQSLLPGEIEGLSILPAGEFDAHKGSKLVHEQFWKKLLDELSSQADLVVINGPIIKSAPEAMTLATTADSVLVTMDLGKTSAFRINEAKDILVKAGANICGVILNQN